MSSHTEENGVKYVLTLSQPNKKVCLKKVNIKDIPPSALGKVIKCKQISPLQLPLEHKAKTNEVELTVVPESTSRDALTSNETAVEVPAAKKIKIEYSPHSDGDDSSSKGGFQSGTYEPEDEEDLDDDEVYDEEIYSSLEAPVRSSTKMSSRHDDYDYTPPVSYKAKRSSTDSEKRRVKPKLFRSEWLDIDIFRDWLDRDPTNPYKARCIACDSIINAGKSELEKHAAGLKHAQALDRMQQEMMSQIDESNEEVQHVDPSEDPNNAQAVMFGEDLQTEMYNVRLQQLDALNRVATAVETLSATTIGVLEKMASTQESLVKIIEQLSKK